ncbi:hypothetical protein HDF16_002328 [Granulicella aggregans]|uniref:Flagellar FliJ protein n=1 Tax=Granulicella aggregans TaxID=474949 RepID=A0A7W7ZD53_9BACT|nr:hypothetical protein [Granulicella aggregans]MBB5057622.1 hypothetical protein [Granulicella aggregans]
MQSRLRSLGRIAAIYQLMEYAHGVELDQARAALHDVETSIRERAEASTRLESAGYEALLEGDRDEWQLDQSEIEFMQWNAKTFEVIRNSRDAALRGVAEVYQASRMQMEKMQSVLSEARLSAAREQERAEQRASDDRYLSRRRWQTRGEENRRSRTERAVSADLPRFGRTA